jgi:hypothetical protein
MEIIVLLENELADGAMARWRTLHEITTVAILIEKYGEDVAERYVNNQIVESKKAPAAYEELLRGNSRRQRCGNVQTRNTNPIICHAVIDVEAIRSTKIIATIDAGRKHDIVHHSVPL